MQANTERAEWSRRSAGRLPWLTWLARRAGVRSRIYISDLPLTTAPPSPSCSYVHRSPQVNRFKSVLVANYTHSLGSEVWNAGTPWHSEVLYGLLSCPTLSLRTHPCLGPSPGLSTQQPGRSLPSATPSCHPGARGCRSALPTWGERPNPFTHRQERPETREEDLHPEEMSPNAQTKTALGKVGPAGTSRMRAQQPLGPSGRAGDALPESPPTFAARF